MLREFIANLLADFYVGLADEIMGRRKPTEVGYSLEVPHNDAWFHVGRISPRPLENCNTVALVCRTVNRCRAMSYKRASPVPE
jgi:hypothetical protein